MGRERGFNRLVDALRAHPEVIDLAAQRQAASFRVLAEALGEAVLGATELELMGRDLDDRLSKAYLPIITGPAGRAEPGRG